jgi:hypothetical protein
MRRASNIYAKAKSDSKSTKSRYIRDGPLIHESVAFPNLHGLGHFQGALKLLIPQTNKECYLLPQLSTKWTVTHKFPSYIFSSG